MRDLLIRALNELHQNQGNHIVRPAIPILYFGDLLAFRRSQLRIITVGLNPSLQEFPRATPYIRFPNGDQVNPALDRQGKRVYSRCLNGYFGQAPYSNWFSTFEPLLNGFDCSYYKQHVNRAIHTDLMTPIATDPTWSGLTQQEKDGLGNAGIPLWHDFVQRVRPHLVFISVARHLLDQISFPKHQNWQIAHTVNGTRPYHFEHAIFQTAPGHLTDFIFGKASRKPFLNVRTIEKRGLAAALRGRSLLKNWP